MLFKLHIPDINLLIQLRHTLEELHLYDEYQLNPKLFQCRPDVMVELLSKLYPEELSDKTIKTDISKMKKCAEEKQCDTCIEKLKKGLVKEGLIDILKVCGKTTAVELLKPVPILGSIVSAVL